MLFPKNAELTERVSKCMFQIMRLLILDGPMKVFELVERIGEKPAVIGQAILQCAKWGFVQSDNRINTFTIMRNRPTLSITDLGREFFSQRALSVNRPKRKPKQR